MNEQEFNEEEIIEGEAEEIPFTDKRRSGGESEMKNADGGTAEEFKSAEVVKLENDLKESRARSEVAEAKLVDVQRRFDEAKNNLEKETAEMRGRLTKTLEQRAKQGQFNFLTTLLPVLDNLILAIDAGEKVTANDNDPTNNNLFDGVKGTARLFEQALMSVGVEPVSAIGETFDPEVHEAVDMVEVSPEKDDIITAEYARGYKFGDKLLRPARVQVGKASAKGANAE